MTEVLRGKDKELIEIIRNLTDWKTLALKVKARGSPLHWGSLLKIIFLVYKTKKKNERSLREGKSEKN